MFKRISGREAQSAIESNPDLQIIDVRTEAEYLQYHIPNSILIPMNEIPVSLHKLEKDRFYLIVCEHSVRSIHVCHFLVQNGLTNIVNIDGGMSEYPGPTVSGRP